MARCRIESSKTLQKITLRPVGTVFLFIVCSKWLYSCVKRSTASLNVTFKSTIIWTMSSWRTWKSLTRKPDIAWKTSRSHIFCGGEGSNHVPMVPEIVSRCSLVFCCRKGDRTLKSDFGYPCHVRAYHPGATGMILRKKHPVPPPRPTPGLLAEICKKMPSSLCEASCSKWPYRCAKRSTCLSKLMSPGRWLGKSKRHPAIYIYIYACIYIYIYFLTLGPVGQSTWRKSKRHPAIYIYIYIHSPIN